ncbi:MAG TPA: TetR/AcrR family transcriptional regulator [Acidimicrobiales bacterium]|jgi:AcrR family transcriptional regulator|nr:TetR/AcrR family transcriptional regulator [Acidimicrobiales bacterium]
MCPIGRQHPAEPASGPDELAATDEATSGRAVLPGTRSPLDPSRALKVGGHGLPREHVRQVQRDRLIDGFVQVVTEEGYDGAGIKAICRRAGVAFNTFYEYFETKEELFLTAYDMGVTILFDRVGRAYQAGDVPWSERVEAGIGEFVQILMDNRPFARFFAVEAVKVGPNVMHRVDADFERSFAMFAHATPTPGVTMAASDLAPLVIGGIYARIYTYIRANQFDRLPELAPILVEFALASFHRSGSTAPTGS